LAPWILRYASAELLVFLWKRILCLRPNTQTYSWKEAWTSGSLVFSLRLIGWSRSCLLCGRADACIWCEGCRGSRAKAHRDGKYTLIQLLLALFCCGEHASLSVSQCLWVLNLVLLKWTKQCELKFYFLELLQLW